MEKMPLARYRAFVAEDVVVEEEVAEAAPVMEKLHRWRQVEEEKDHINFINKCKTLKHALLWNENIKIWLFIYIYAYIYILLFVDTQIVKSNN